jgi:hypothetical protein
MSQMELFFIPLSDGFGCAVLSGGNAMAARASDRTEEQHVTTLG